MPGITSAAALRAEHAPIAIKESGIACVVANTFARIFYRNALNTGLPILECPEAVAGISEGDTVEIDLEAGRITNVSTNKTFQAKAFPPFMCRLIDAGGLVNYAKARLKGV